MRCLTHWRLRTDLVRSACRPHRTHGPQAQMHASLGATLHCRLFTPEIATFYEEFLTSKGITFIKGDTASSFEGKDGKASRLRHVPCTRKFLPLAIMLWWPSTLQSQTERIATRSSRVYLNRKDEDRPSFSVMALAQKSDG